MYHPSQHHIQYKQCETSAPSIDPGYSGNSTYGLAQRTALADGNPVTLLNTERGGDVSSQVLMALLVTVVLGDVVKVFTADDDGTVHLGRDDTAGKDTATDGDLTDEGALLVCSTLATAHSHNPIITACLQRTRR